MAMTFDWGNAFRGGMQGGILPGVVAGFTNGDPTKRANKYLDQIPDELRKYLMPFINRGNTAGEHLNDISGEYESMYKDPNSIISKIGSGYTESPGFKWRLGQGENAINNAAASGGYAGTSQHQQRAGELATNIASQDFNDFMERALGMRREGLTGRTGIEQDFYNKGYGASGDLASSIANWLNQKGGMAYQDQKNKNQQWSDALSSLTSNIGNFAKFFGGGG
jgi:hypothetical protein